MIRINNLSPCIIFKIIQIIVKRFLIKLFIDEEVEKLNYPYYYENFRISAKIIQSILSILKNFVLILNQKYR